MHEEIQARIQGIETGFPFVPAVSPTTPKGTPYLTTPGVHLIARPHVSVASLGEFLCGFSGELDFPQYLEDPPLQPGAQICKFAGQLCYMSFGPKRTRNADALRYFDNIKSSGHGSVLEHANFSFLFYGISRSVTHELVRHRAGFGFSQVSQRYVSGKVLRFVERPEYVHDPELHELFVQRIDRAASDYDRISLGLIERQKAGVAIMGAEARTDLRKKVQQAARSVLPNETEAPIVVTGNARAWRHFVEMRANPHAETEIRALAFNTYLCLAATDTILFGDYRIVEIPDGTCAVETDYNKV